MNTKELGCKADNIRFHVLDGRSSVVVIKRFSASHIFEAYSPSTSRSIGRGGGGVP
jgi:hypothetical protein